MLRSDELGNSAPPEEAQRISRYLHFYTKGTDRRVLLEQMQAKMEITLAEIWAERAPGLPLDRPADLVKLASIIEKETGQSGEKPPVSSVFINRLEKDMRLQLTRQWLMVWPVISRCQRCLQNLTLPSGINGTRIGSRGCPSRRLQIQAISHHMRPLIRKTQTFLFCG